MGEPAHLEVVPKTSERLQELEATRAKLQNIDAAQTFNEFAIQQENLRLGNTTP